METVLYIATSADGFIATPDGSVSFLDPFSAPDEDYGYRTFMRGVDSVVMGRKTYDHARALGPWEHEKRHVAVMTHFPVEDAPKGVFKHDGPVDALLPRLVDLGAKRVWVCGGASVVRAFLDADALDELRVFVMPVLLGDGIPLFARAARPALPLKAQRTRAWANGVIRLTWKRERPS